MQTKPLSERMDYSRGFDRGNYGNAYESQDWDTWSVKNGYDDTDRPHFSDDAYGGES